ncbi:P-loop NTPase fold protein [Paenibacillus sp. NPDC057967]|uniref:P-loop NTPase fold protein n=1 Tax=Paenibacillus sp. NPDC057967 TaxID=3346293 RepID=UPI0036D7AA09
MYLDWMNKDLFNKLQHLNEEIQELKKNSDTIGNNFKIESIADLNRSYLHSHKEQITELENIAREKQSMFGSQAKLYKSSPMQIINGFGQVVRDSLSSGISIRLGDGFSLRFIWTIDKNGAQLQFGHFLSPNSVSKSFQLLDHFVNVLISQQNRILTLLDNGYQIEHIKSKRVIRFDKYIDGFKYDGNIRNTAFVYRLDKEQLINNPDLFVRQIRWMIEEFFPVVDDMLRFNRYMEDMSSPDIPNIPSNLMEKIERVEVRELASTSEATLDQRSHTSGIQLTPYLSDQNFRQDLLNIGEDVGSLARLVSMRDVDNMAIGLFGSWGAGKSFFMKQMQQQVTELSQREDKLFHKKIVQIEFNAWHYMDTNLYASLADHIFKSIHESYSDHNDSVDKLFESLPVVSKLNEELKELEQKKQEQKLKVEAKSQESVWGKLAASSPQFINELEAIDPQIRLKDHVQKVIELREAGRQWSSDLKENFLKAQLIYRFMPRWVWGMLLVLCLLIPIAYITRPLWGDIVTNAWHQTILWFSPIAATMMFLINLWNNKHVKVMRKSWGYVFDSLAAQAKEREELHSEMEAIEEERLSVVAELDEIKSGNIIKYYLEERLTSEAYKKELGIIHILRNDFEKLSQFMQTTQGQKNSVDRIVLYIDDLDRCSPQKVIEVLQAVHLMLSSNLFMVVVAVDIRWVTKCLKEEFKVSLENHENTHIASAFDYLEKIFQITFQIKPLTEEDGRTYLQGLFESDNRQTMNDEDVEEEESEIIEMDDEEYETFEFDDDIIHSDPSVQETGGASDDYKRLHLSETEIISASAYAALIGSSPRTMKRFVNIYRLMRSRYFNDFSQEAALFMLSLTLGYPQVSRELVVSIQQSAEQISLLEALSKLDSALDGMSRVVSFVEDRGLRRLPSTDVLKSAVRVSRYTFYLNEI